MMLIKSKPFEFRNPCTEFERKIYDKTASISIFGLGYVGLPLANAFVQENYNVTGIDICNDRINTLKENKDVKFNLLNPNDSKSEYFRHLEYSDIFIICVPTPLKDNVPNLQYINAVMDDIQAAIIGAAVVYNNIRPRLIILESTTYPGCTSEIYSNFIDAINRLDDKHAKHKLTSELYVAYSPERENPGQKKFTLRNTPKVVGGVDGHSTDLAWSLYESICDSVVNVSGDTVAEMVKLLENTYRCVNIALINELKLFCDKLGIDINEVIDAAKTKPYGFQAFYPSAGVGGHCIPIDPIYLSWAAKKLDFFTRFIDLATEINTRTPYNIVDSIKDTFLKSNINMADAKIRILGVAYKPGIDDDRESPAYTIMKILMDSFPNIELSYFDPYIPVIRNGGRVNGMTSTIYEDDVVYDAQIVVSGHRCIDYTYALKKSTMVFDTCNCIDPMFASVFPNYYRI